MIKYYFDENMFRSVANQLIDRGIDVVMAVDVDMMGKDDDEEHLPYAMQHNRVLVTFDKPFAGRTMKHNNHAGLICLSNQLAYAHDIGEMIRQLADFAETYDSTDVIGRVFWLPRY